MAAAGGIMPPADIEGRLRAAISLRRRAVESAKSPLSPRESGGAPMRRLFGLRLSFLALAGLLLSAGMLRGDDESAGGIVASKNSKVYHSRTCSSAKKLNLSTA